MPDLIENCKSCNIKLDGKYEQRIGYCTSCLYQYEDEAESYYNQNEEEE